MKDILKFHSSRRYVRRSGWGTAQVAISAKIDTELDTKMAKEMAVEGIKKNRLLNMALAYYLEALDEARREKAAFKDILNAADDTLTVGELEELDFTCRSLGASKQDFIAAAVREKLQRFKEKPFGELL